MHVRRRDQREKAAALGRRALDEGDEGLEDSVGEARADRGVVDQALEVIQDEETACKLVNRIRGGVAYAVRGSG